MSRTGLDGKACAPTPRLTVSMASARILAIIGNSLSVDIRRLAGSGRVVEVAARESRLAAAVAREQFGLAAFSPRVHFRGIAEAAEFRLEPGKRRAPRRIARQVDKLFGVGLKVEKLRP